MLFGYKNCFINQTLLIAQPIVIYLILCLSRHLAYPLKSHSMSWDKLLSSGICSDSYFLLCCNYSSSYYMLTSSTLVSSASWFSLSLITDDHSWLYYLTDPFQTGALLGCLLWAVTRGKEYMPVPVDPCPNSCWRSSIRHFLSHPSYFKISSRKSSCMPVLSPMPVVVKFWCPEWLHQVIIAPYRTISKSYLFTIDLPNIILHCISDLCGYLQNWERSNSLLNIRNFWFTLCPLVLLKLGSIFSEPHEKTLWNC